MLIHKDIIFNISNLFLSIYFLGVKIFTIARDSVGIFRHFILQSGLSSFVWSLISGAEEK